jgi:hypothetical protein
MYQLMESWSPPMGGLQRRVINLDTGAVISLNPDSTDYQAYLKWLEEGNTPLPPDEPN